jgi:hypothetical protein
VVLKNGVDLFLLLCSGRCCKQAASLETLDAAPVYDFAFEARVRGMATRAHVEHELGS